MQKMKRKEEIALNLSVVGFVVGCAVLIYGIFTCPIGISLVAVLGGIIIAASLIGAALICYRDTNDIG